MAATAFWLLAYAVTFACLSTAQAAIIVSTDTNFGYGVPDELAVIYNASQTLAGRKNMLKSALGVSDISGFIFVYEDAVRRDVGKQFCEQFRNGATSIPVATFNDADGDARSVAIAKYEVLAADAGCGYDNFTGPDGKTPSNVTSVVMASYGDAKSNNKMFYAGICPANAPACLVFRVEKHDTSTAGRRLLGGAQDLEAVLAARRHMLQDSSKCNMCEDMLDNCLSADSMSGAADLGCQWGYDYCHDHNNCPGGCFPGLATVQVQGKGAVRMEELQYGDKVLAVDHASRVPTYKEVYLFGHRDPAQMAQFVQLTLTPMASGLQGPSSMLQLTPTHFIPVCTSKCTPQDLAAGASMFENRYGKDVHVEDIVMVSTDNNAVELAIVSSVGASIESGLFNPYIRGADLVVDGVVASAHSEWLLDNVVPTSMSKHLPAIYEALLTPVYWLYCMVGPRVGEWLAHGLGLVDMGGKDSYGVSYVAFMSGAVLPMLVAAAMVKQVVGKKLC